MFDEGTNAVTMNLPQQVEMHRQATEKQLNIPHPKSNDDNVDDNLANNFIDNQLMSIADSLYQEGIKMHWPHVCSVNLIGKF